MGIKSRLVWAAALAACGCGAPLIPRRLDVHDFNAVHNQRLRVEQAYRDDQPLRKMWRGLPLKELFASWGLPDESVLDQRGNGRLVYRLVNPYPVEPDFEPPAHGLLVVVQEALIVDVVKF